MPILTSIRGLMAGVSVGMGMMLGAAIGAGVMFLGMELYFWGGPSFRIPLYGQVDLPPEGVVARLLKAERDKCTAEKKASQEAAERFDLEQQRDAAQRHSEELQAAIERTLAAQQDLITFQETVTDEMRELQKAADAADAASGGTVRTRIICNAGPRTAAGLQRRNLPYPDTLVPGDQ